MQVETQLLKAPEAAAFLSIGRRKLWELTNRNAVPSLRIDRAVRYCTSDLRAWIAAGCPTDAGAADRVRKGAGR